MFSVVIPTYNRVDLVVNTVVCVQNQTFKPDEIIIVNNGNHKITYDLFKNKKNLVIINTMVKAGVSQARNIGVTFSKNDWIAFIDDDDLWEDKYLEKAKRLIDEKKPDCILARRDKLTKEGIIKYKDFAQFENDSNLLEKLLLNNFGAGGSNTIIKKSVFMSIGGYNVKLDMAEDRSLVIECLLNGFKVQGASDIQCIVRKNMEYDRLTSQNKKIIGVLNYLSHYYPIAISMDKQTKNSFKFMYYKYKIRYYWSRLVSNSLSKFQV